MEMQVLQPSNGVGTDIRPIDNSPAAMLITAMNSGMDLDKLEKFMELQERYEKNEARKAYHEAMAAFKANPPKIEKDKHVQFDAQGGTVDYHHASLANVTEKINSALSVHGLSAAWGTFQDEKAIKVTCTITHKMGHSESTFLTGAPDVSGKKNPIQSVGSTISYLERYTLLALTGLATHDMDDDGKGGEEVKYITIDQKTDIDDKIKGLNVNEVQFLAYLSKSLKTQIDSVEKIPAKGYTVALAALNAKKTAKPKEGTK